ncbi:MAG: DNA double-strand break repair nuclease NurA [Anaerolineales bacterium]|jgi:hypothetical protein|nr:DNA double-strand break repair nuclease NurA [Anaerolineales bacterium]
MALELNKLTEQVAGMGATLLARSNDLAARLPQARAALQELDGQDPALQQKIERALSLHWAGAIPTDEPANAIFPCPQHPPLATIIAADGSQVYPDRHGIALYYLINTGSIVFRHGMDDAPTCASQPRLFYENEDLYLGEQLIQGALVDSQRDLAELRELARLTTAEGEAIPTLALMDNGLLLYLGLHSSEQRRSDEILRDYLRALREIEVAGAAISGVIDRPRAANVLRLLHLAGLENADFEAEDLRQLGNYAQLTDRMLFSTLKPGERSALFVNASPENMEKYMPRGHKIMFFYVNTGTAEQSGILRVELPEWVAAQPQQLELVHAGVVEQARFGGGFPYVLIRAHELAVVTWAQRGQLQQMVSGSMQRSGLSPNISRKAQGKQWTDGG